MLADLNFKQVLKLHWANTALLYFKDVLNTVFLTKKCWFTLSFSENLKMRFLGLGLRPSAGIMRGLKVNFKSLFCSLFFGEHQGEVQCSDGFCEAWPVLCLFRPAFSESEEEELQDAGLPGNWWQRSNQSLTLFFFNSVCVWVCVFFNLYPFLEIFFFIQIIVLSNWRFFVWHPHGLGQAAKWLCFFYCSTSCLCFNLRSLSYPLGAAPSPQSRVCFL